MLMPSIFGEKLFDDWFDEFPFWDDRTQNGIEKKLYGRHAQNLMKTDVREGEKDYEVMIDLPGFKKDEINVQLENGYLTISAAKGLDQDKQDENGKYIRRERYAGSMSRSFYVGDNVAKEDIHAKFENGILKLEVPKSAPEAVEQNKYIAIEG